MAAPRSGRHTGCLHHWQSSVEWRSHRYREPAPTFVGAGLARDGSTAIRQAYRVPASLAIERRVALPQIPGTRTNLSGSRACPRWRHRDPAGIQGACITGNRASSGAPTDTGNPHQPLWEPGLPAMAAPRSGRHTGLPASLAIERRAALPLIPGNRTNLCGSRACPRWQHRDPAGIPGGRHTCPVTRAALMTPAKADPAERYNPDSSAPDACPMQDSPARWQPVACPAPNAG